MLPESYVLTFKMNDAGEWGALCGAVKRLYFLVKGEGSIPMQMLETIWITKMLGPSRRRARVLFWDEIMEIAHDNGWIAGGQWKGG